MKRAPSTALAELKRGLDILRKINDAGRPNFQIFQAKQISAAVASPLAVHTGSLRGTNVVNRPFVSNGTARKIGLSLRRCTRQSKEFSSSSEELSCRPLALHVVRGDAR
jgi:hypothetical protein